MGRPQWRRRRYGHEIWILEIAGEVKRITPAGGGDPAGVIDIDWQLGGGVLPIDRRGAGRRRAPLRIPSITVSGNLIFRRHAGPDHLAFPQPVALKRRLVAVGSSSIRCLQYSRVIRFCAVQYGHGWYALPACRRDRIVTAKSLMVFFMFR